MGDNKGLVELHYCGATGKAAGSAHQVSVPLLGSESGRSVARLLEAGKREVGDTELFI
jgi:hypothetical protein